MLTATVAGLVTGLSLIVAIGAQNAFVLRQGIARQYVGPVVTVCALSDLLLIAAGVAGIGAVVHHAHWLVETVRWFGVVFLVGYAARSLAHARNADSLEAASGSSGSWRRTTRTALALTWLNPHVYLDTVLLLGSIAATHGPHGRWAFAVGAGTASVAWFSGLGYGSRLLHGVLATARAWRVLDVVIAATMLGVAAQLAISA